MLSRSYYAKTVNQPASFLRLARQRPHRRSPERNDQE